MILEIFNSLHVKLQFTVKTGIEDRLSFLDTMIIIDNHKIIFDRYRKVSCSGRFLNFYSHHPLSDKKDVIFDFVDKINKLPHPRFHEKKLG